MEAAREFCMSAAMHLDSNAPLDAVKDFAKAVQACPACAMAYSGRASALIQLQKPLLAVHDCDKAIELQPDDASAFYYRGNAMWLLKRNDEAIRDCSSALALEPKHALAYSCRGAARSAKKEFQMAVEDYTKAISLLPDHTISFCGRGIARCFLQDFAAAQRDLSKAMALAPNYAVAKEWLDNAKQGEQRLAARADKMAALLLQDEQSRAEPNKKKKSRKKKKKKQKHSSNTAELPPQQPAPPVQVGLKQARQAGRVDEISQKQSQTEAVARPSDSGNRTDTKKQGHQDGNEQASNQQSARSTDAPHGVKPSLLTSLLSVECTAMVEAAIAVGTARAVGTERVSEDMCLAAALQMQKQTRNVMLSRLKDEYLADFVRRGFQESTVHKLTHPIFDSSE